MRTESGPQRREMWVQNRKAATLELDTVDKVAPGLCALLNTAKRDISRANFIVTFSRC